MNGGVCSDSPQGFVCDCTGTGHSGARCEVFEGIVYSDLYITEVAVNFLEGDGIDPFFNDVGEPIVYYANTYVPEPENTDDVIAHTTYEGDRFVAAVRKNNAWGVQFHPEKSSTAGLAMIGNFLREVRR